MNKFIFTALLIASVNANAEAWYSSNKAGGQIVITDSVCSLNGQVYKKLKQSHTRSADGQTIYGCWYYENATIHVVYQDGTQYSYMASSFSKLSDM